MRSRVLPPRKAEPLRTHLPAILIWTAIILLCVLAVVIPTSEQPLKGFAVATFVALVVGVVVWR